MHSPVEGPLSPQGLAYLGYWSNPWHSLTRFRCSRKRDHTVQQLKGDNSDGNSSLAQRVAGQNTSAQYYIRSSARWSIHRGSPTTHITPFNSSNRKKPYVHQNFSCVCYSKQHDLSDRNTVQLVHTRNPGRLRTWACPSPVLHQPVDAGIERTDVHCSVRRKTLPQILSMLMIT